MAAAGFMPVVIYLSLALGGLPTAEKLRALLQLMADSDDCPECQGETQ
jgi:hypothetical protein